MVFLKSIVDEDYKRINQAWSGSKLEKGEVKELWAEAIQITTKEATMTIFRKVLERLQKWKLDHDGIRTNTAQKTADRHEQLEDQVEKISTRLVEDTVEAQEIICNEVANEDVLKNDTTEDRKRFIETVNSRLEK